MWSRALVILTGVIFISHQIFARDTYIAELMIQSNVTLDESTLLTTLNGPFTVNGQQINIIKTELVAECLLTGSETECNCTEGYIWTNEVCYDYNCCNGSPCHANISYIPTSICIAKVKVRINGTISKSEMEWTDDENTVKQKLEDGLKQLNALEGVNITKRSSDPSIADFEAEFSVFFETLRLQTAVTDLEKSLAATILVDTFGMVCIDYPNGTVLYEGNATLKCTFGEATDSSGWNMSRMDQRFELNEGSVVCMDDCPTEKNTSCAKITLKKVTEAWAGTYECGFTIGSVRHTAKANLMVALLPDTITITTDPLTVDCKENKKVKVTAAIQNITEKLVTTWSYRGKDKIPMKPNGSDGNIVNYTVDQVIDCEERETPQTFRMFFENQWKQVKSETVDIPVIYAGSKICEEKEEDNITWPKAPYGSTVINPLCPPGRVGYRERTCDDSGEWMKVYSNCVNEKLNKVKIAAANFLKGLGATNEVALEIFSGLLNSTMSDATTSPMDTMADLNASVTVLDSMAKASDIISLDEGVFDGFLGAASNMLNQSWDKVNKTIEYGMSTKYLTSVEDLVKNIKVNNSEGHNTENLELKICRANSSDCNRTVFGVGVNLDKSYGITKTMAMKKLVEKLPDSNSENIRASERSSLLVSTTVTNSTGSSINITLSFPEELTTNKAKAHCVFWNTTTNEWSGKGCSLKTDMDNFTLCQCNHLTSFSYLMSKNPVDLPFEKEITYIGLGVSICSLLVFLIIEAAVWSAVVKSNLSLFRHTAMVNISICLFLALCSFLASHDPPSLGDSVCLVLALCKHFFFLAMFCWTLCLSTMLVHQLIFVFSPLRKRVFMFLASIVGYVCPSIIVGASYVYYRYTKKPYQKGCWLIYEELLKGSVHAFILPMGIIVMTNLFCMGVVILTLTKSTVSDGSDKDKDTAKGVLKVVVILTPLFGVTWFLGFLMFIFDDMDTYPWAIFLKYGFTILNSFQGFFILITGCFAEQKVREELFKLIMAKAPLKGKSESMKQLTTTTKEN